MINRRTKRIAAIAVGLSLIAAACGDDDDDGGDDATIPKNSPGRDRRRQHRLKRPESTDGSRRPPRLLAPETTGRPRRRPTPAEAAAMTVTYTLSDAAVWSDGSPMSWEDFECTWQASLNTPESITTTGYNQITSVTAGATDKEVVVNFDPPFAAYKTLFAQPILKASQHADCNDVTDDFQWRVHVRQQQLHHDRVDARADRVRGQRRHTRAHGPATVPKIVIVPAEDGPTLLKAGTVDFIFPQGYTGLDQELADPNIDFAAEGGGSYEGLYFQQDDNCVPDENRSCAFADDDFRAAFSKSIDIDARVRADLRAVRAGPAAADLRPDRPRPVLRPGLRRTRTIRQAPSRS